MLFVALLVSLGYLWYKLVKKSSAQDTEYLYTLLYCDQSLSQWSLLKVKTANLTFSYFNYTSAFTKLWKVEPRSHFISRLSVIVRVDEVLNRTVVAPVTNVSTTCVVTFRVKVSCITSVDGIRFWLYIDLIGPQAFGYFFNHVLLWDNFDGEVRFSLKVCCKRWRRSVNHTSCPQLHVQDRSSRRTTIAFVKGQSVFLVVQKHFLVHLACAFRGTTFETRRSTRMLGRRFKGLRLGCKFICGKPFFR